MKVIKTEKKLCHTCMEEHAVQTVIVHEVEEFKDEEIWFDAIYEYCEHEDEFLETEEMNKANSLAMKDAYREKVKLLTSKEIIAIREKYGVSQKDFSEILDWGMATITRYENHQVQDRAHDDLLRVVDTDPMWFLEILKRSEGKISKKAYQKYLKNVKAVIKSISKKYLRNAIHAEYIDITSDSVNGGVELNLNKVIEMMNYFALKIEEVHKVKLAKLLWYAEFLSYKTRKKSIGGLTFSRLPMGAVPHAYDQIINLEGITFAPVKYDNGKSGIKFSPTDGFEVHELTSEEIEILDKVILEVGDLDTNGIVEHMHNEVAYLKTEENETILYSYADQLSF